eukprot:COSAG01_NODE_6709_length_3534_cov_2.341776_3_plen_25_part_01
MFSCFPPPEFSSFAKSRYLVYIVFC